MTSQYKHDGLMGECGAILILANSSPILLLTTPAVSSPKHTVSAGLSQPFSSMQKKKKMPTFLSTAKELTLKLTLGGVDGFRRGNFFYLKAIWNAIKNEMRNNEISLGEFLKNPKMCPPTIWSQLENIIDKLFFLKKHEEETWAGPWQGKKNWSGRSTKNINVKKGW